MLCELHEQRLDGQRDGEQVVGVRGLGVVGSLASLDGGGGTVGGGVVDGCEERKGDVDERLCDDCGFVDALEDLHESLPYVFERLLKFGCHGCWSFPVG